MICAMERGFSNQSWIIARTTQNLNKVWTVFTHLPNQLHHKRLEIKSCSRRWYVHIDLKGHIPRLTRAGSCPRLRRIRTCSCCRTLLAAARPGAKMAIEIQSRITSNYEAERKQCSWQVRWSHSQRTNHIDRRTGSAGTSGNDHQTLCLRRCIRREARKVEEQVGERYSIAWNQSKYQTCNTSARWGFQEDQRKPEAVIEEAIRVAFNRRSKEDEQMLITGMAKRCRERFAPLLPANHGHLQQTLDALAQNDPRSLTGPSRSRETSNWSRRGHGSVLSSNWITTTYSSLSDIS